MVRIKQGNLNVISWRQLNLSWSMQRYGLQEVFEVFIVLFAGLSYSFLEVDPVRIPLETE